MVLCHGPRPSYVDISEGIPGDATTLHTSAPQSEQTSPFKTTSEHGGIKATFMNKYDWYEEYPTRPSSFVLNGFIYSLIGLYDVAETAGNKLGREAGVLFSQGLESLKAMLPLFDTGSGTVYDLRHFTLGVAPNLARWDYHTTHINQLQLLRINRQRPHFQGLCETLEDLPERRPGQAQLDSL